MGTNRLLNNNILFSEITLIWPVINWRNMPEWLSKKVHGTADPQKLFAELKWQTDRQTWGPTALRPKIVFQSGRKMRKWIETLRCQIH